ncbi:YggS family pyridoxal phosphate-dependent enzyme [Clostridiaceae bacterium HSG29]|nr:YggS family pyridoxal phosphate-dependent enzyme [Clostridiaceae bacterium HSG29]
MLEKSEILSNLNIVKENIENACKRVDRENDVVLIPVTKTFPHELVQTCIDLNIEEVGENRPLEIRDKYELYHDQVKIHMIGHLQTNKIKYIGGKVVLIHSLDSVKLANELNKYASKNDIVFECLVQVNIAKEEAKFGISESNIMEFLKEFEQFENIRIMGLMNMAPFYNDSEDARNDFKKMKVLFESLKNEKFKNAQMKYLSMGMINDYVVAVEEGSNMVRIGSAIFGNRTYL